MKARIFVGTDADVEKSLNFILQRARFVDVRFVVQGVHSPYGDPTVYALLIYEELEAINP